MIVVKPAPIIMAISTIKGSGFKIFESESRYSVKQGSTWEYTGESVTIPPHTAYGLQGFCYYDTTPNINAGFCTSDSNFAYYNRKAMAGVDGENGGDVYITGYNGNDSPRTYYLWGKWADATANYCGIRGWFYTP